MGDLVTLIAAADLTWTHEFVGDQPSAPAYIRHLARCVEAGRALRYEPTSSSSDAPNRTATEGVAGPSLDDLSLSPEERAVHGRRDYVAKAMWEHDQDEGNNPFAAGWNEAGNKSQDSYLARADAALAGLEAWQARRPVAHTDLWGQIALAISDPGAFVQREKVSEDGRYETVSRWGARAVCALVAPVLAERDELRHERDALADSIEPSGECRQDCDCGDHQGPGSCGCHVTGEEAREWIRRLDSEVDRVLAELDALKASTRLVWLPEFGEDEEIPLGEPTVHNHADGRFVLRGGQPDTEATTEQADPKKRAETTCASGPTAENPATTPRGVTPAPTTSPREPWRTTTGAATALATQSPIHPTEQGAEAGEQAGECKPTAVPFTSDAENASGLAVARTEPRVWRDIHEQEWTERPDGLILTYQGFAFSRSQLEELVGPLTEVVEDGAR